MAKMRVAHLAARPRPEQRQTPWISARLASKTAARAHPAQWHRVRALSARPTCLKRLDGGLRPINRPRHPDKRRLDDLHSATPTFRPLGQALSGDRPQSARRCSRPDRDQAGRIPLLGEVRQGPARVTVRTPLDSAIPPEKGWTIREKHLKPAYTPKRWYEAEVGTAAISYDRLLLPHPRHRSRPAPRGLHGPWAGMSLRRRHRRLLWLHQAVSSIHR